MALSKEPRSIINAAEKFVSFLNLSPSPYHAVDQVSKMLLENNFTEVKESAEWSVRPNSTFFVTRNKSTLVAIAVGGKYVPGNGFSLIAAHTDSPCLKMKPVSKTTRSGALQVGVAPYGGGLWRTWFDRDLSLAGRVIARVGEKFEHRLVHIPEPIMYLPNLAIHLDDGRNESFKFNAQNHLVPILATEVFDKANAEDVDCEDEEAQKEKAKVGVVGSHHKSLLDRIASSAGVKVDDIVDFEMCLCGTQDAVIGGLHKEFIFGPRLDNLVGTYTAVNGLIQSLENNSLAEDTNIRVVVCYDNEEVGSQSAQGAKSSLTEWVLRRLSGDQSSPGTCRFEQAMPKSYLISADQAHARHPNYMDKYESENHALFHDGVVIKINQNQHYATTAITHSILKEIANDAKVPLKEFVVRNDSPCGSTVGPILSAALGLQTIDVGMPQLAMHSIREMACTSGIYHGTQLFKHFFKTYPKVFEKMDFL